MVEPIMYFAIGFLVAALFALMFFPLVHNRAVRLTMRRLEAATPLTIAEIRADKDQLRAEFAMSTRRLELSVDQMKVTTTAQLAELGKKSDAINQLKKELGEKTAAFLAFEARDKSLVDQLRASEEEFQLKSSALREAERALADKEAELSKLLAELGDHSIAADSQRLELAALRTQVEAMKVTVAEYEQTTKASAERLERERSEAAAGASELTDARAKLEGLNARAGELERQVLSHTVEAELLNKRLQELETRLGDQGRLLVERDYEIEQLRGEVEAAQANERDAGGKSSGAGKRAGRAAEKYKSDIAKLETELASTTEERTKLLAEIGDLKRAAESSWAAERVENALLRERINDIAAEIAHLTATLEGPGSPIDALVSGAHDMNHSGGQTNGKPAINGTLAHGEAGPAQIASAAGQKNTLADRIRALQSTASRAASANSTQNS
jgi:chromosome segregation ATPase